MRRMPVEACARGYTLIEILVVMLIISIVTSVAVLSIRTNKRKEVEIYTGELVQTLTLVSEEALLHPSVFALRVSKDKLVLEYQDSQDPAHLRFRVWHDHYLHLPDMPFNLTYTLLLPHEAGDQTVKRILFAKNGTLTPFQLTIKEGATALFKIIGEGDGRITQKALDE